MSAPLSLVTDYAHDRNPVRDCLRQIALAGFTAVHWCQHWNDDYVYTPSEIRTIVSWLREYGLTCPDLHASAGTEKNWGSPDDYARQAGLELVENRMNLAAELGADAVVLHPSMVFVKSRYDGRATLQAERVAAMKSALPELVRLAEKTGIRIAFENMPFSPGISDLLSDFLEAVPAERIGICYDAGHGHIVRGSLEWLDRWKDRLFVVHLHDNKGRKDQHLIPFTGSVDWPAVMDLIAKSSYRKPLTLELWRWTLPKLSESAFLTKAFESGKKLQGMKKSD